MKKKVLASKFLKWFLSDKDDIIRLGNVVKSIIQEKGICCISVESLFNTSGYIPGHIVEGGDTEREYELEECEIINDLKND